MAVTASLLTPPAIYRGRIAPSPTGLLHLGHARTFWIAYQRARAVHGTLVLRVEDLDPQRSRPQFTAALLEDLEWLGIRWQEGPAGPQNIECGAFGPYAQSERYALYRAAWDHLRTSGWIYPCHCSRRELSLAAAAPHEDQGNDGPPDPHSGDGGGCHPAAHQDGPQEGVHEHDDEPLYPGTCRPPAGTVSALKTPARVNWRFRVPPGESIVFSDGNLGDQTFVAGKDFGDFLVWRRDDVPAYQLAVVVDDAAMQITEVVRGADLLKSTARQILLNRALGYTNPAWFHCELFRDEHGQRLAKRHDALSLCTLREHGVTPQQVLQSALTNASLTNANLAKPGPTKDLSS